MPKKPERGPAPENICTSCGGTGVSEEFKLDHAKFSSEEAFEKLMHIARRHAVFRFLDRRIADHIDGWDEMGFGVDGGIKALPLLLKDVYNSWEDEDSYFDQAPLIMALAAACVYIVESMDLPPGSLK